MGRITVSKSILSLITICLLNASLYAYSGGSGDPNDPYQIATAQDLIDLGNEPNDYDKHFIMTADIDFVGHVFYQAVIAPAVLVWDSESFSNNLSGESFSGSFHGQGYAIRNLPIYGYDKDVLGLFGHTDERAVITSVGLKSTSVESNGDYIGCLVGYNRGTVSSCYSMGAIIGNDCSGGLVGMNSGTITSSYSTVDVDPYKKPYVYNSTSRNMGGLAGSNRGTIISSYSAGTVSGAACVGGLVGFNGGSIISSYSTGTVSASEYLGGLVGFNGTSITSCYSTGRVIALGYRDIGGLVGYTFGTGVVTSSFWNLQTSGQSASSGGKGLFTATMQKTASFLDAGWDFIDENAHGTCDFWTMSAGSYPRLAVFAGHTPSEPEGSGTLNNPYLLRDANDLGSIWYRSEANYRLESDIDMTGIEWLAPVIPAFSGGFDGNGHVIHHLQIHGGSYVGLFGACSPRGTISHIGLEDMNINGRRWFIGSLVGFNEGTVTSSYSTGTTSGFHYIGGLVGQNNGTITSSYSSVTVSGNTCVGGLVGRNRGPIISSYSMGAITGKYYEIGGLVGDNDGLITSSYSTGAVSGDKDVGGLVGRNRDNTITSSFWDIETSGLDTSSGGIGLTTVEMMDIKTFLDVGWDFIGETINGPHDIWTMPKHDYPRLTWEFAGPNLPSADHGDY